MSAHTTAHMALARRLWADGEGWSFRAIARHLAEREGVRVDPKTVQCWVDPDFAERRRAEKRAARRRAAISDPRVLVVDPNREMTNAELDERMLELRRRGVTYVAISVVMDVYHGVTISEYAVRWRLRAMGVKPQAGKSAAMRRQWAEQKAAERREHAAA